MADERMPGGGNRSVTEGFEIRGVNHLALVCRDMAATVAFYEGILGMPLIKTIQGKTCGMTDCGDVTEYPG